MKDQFFVRVPPGKLISIFSVMWTLGMCACAPKMEGKYQFKKMRDSFVVLPPPYWKQAANKPVKVQISIPKISANTKADDCSIASSLLRLSPRSQHTPTKWIATLPSLGAWEEAISNESFSHEFDHFLAEIDRLKLNGCLPAGAARFLEQGIRSSVPVQVHETLYYRYGWTPGAGFIDLEPGMRLKIERAELDPSRRGARTGTTYYQVEQDSDQAIAFRLMATKTKNAPNNDAPDQRLASEMRGTFFAGLFLSGEHVPTSLNYTALLIGTRTRGQMDEFAKALEAHPEMGCPPWPNQQVRCVSFRGAVTVSVEFHVAMNGQRAFVGIDDNLRRLVDRSGSQCMLRSFRMKRTFLNEVYPFEFDQMDDSALKIVLVGKDRVVCSATH
jgi:hypothetical protein